MKHSEVETPKFELWSATMCDLIYCYVGMNLVATKGGAENDLLFSKLTSEVGLLNI